MDSRQRSVANSRQKSRTNSRQKSIANSGQGEPKDCDRDEAKFEENTAQRKAAVSQSQMSSRGDTSQQGRYELKLGEVITTIPNRRCPSCEATPGRHHRTAGRSAMKIQMDKRCVQHSSGSGAKKQTVFDVKVGADLSFTGVSPCRRTKGGTKMINCYLRENNQNSRKHVD